MVELLHRVLLHRLRRQALLGPGGEKSPCLVAGLLLVVGDRGGVVLLHFVEGLHLQLVFAQDVLVREGLLQVFDRILFDHVARAFLARLDDGRFGLGPLFLQSPHARLLLHFPHLLLRVLGRPERLQIVVQDRVALYTADVRIGRAVILFDEHCTRAFVIMVHSGVAFITQTPLAMTT